MLIPPNFSVSDLVSEQTLEAIEKFLRSRQKGDEVGILVSGAFSTLEITAVTSVSLQKWRLYTEKTTIYGGQAWYLKSGKNCWSPKGAGRLVIPTEIVRQYIKDNHQISKLRTCDK